MKTIRQTIAILAIAFCTLFVEGGQTNNYNLPFGSVESVEAHALTLIDYSVLVVYQINTNKDERTDFFYVGDLHGFKNRQELDNWFQTNLQKGLAEIFASTNADLGGTFTAFAYVGNWYMAYNQFWYLKEFSLTLTDGQYAIPDFSKAQMSLSYRIPYIITNINWAIMEMFDKNGSSIWVRDSRFEPEPSIGGVDTYGDLLILPTEFIIGDTNYTVKLVVVSDDEYRVYDRTGKQVAETPAKLSIGQSSYGKTVSVVGGDPGRQLTLQQSTNMVSWFDLSGAHIVGYTGSDNGFSYTDTDTGSGRFFRVKKDVPSNL